MMIARIYTEDKHRTWIVVLIETAGFDSFTLISTRRFWKGEEEASLIIEIICDDNDFCRRKVKWIAGRINDRNNQQATMILFGVGSGVLITNKIKRGGEVE